MAISLNLWTGIVGRLFLFATAASLLEHDGCFPPVASTEFDSDMLRQSFTASRSLFAKKKKNN